MVKPMSIRRVAAIDIGTNTTLLLIAERGPQETGGALRAVFEDMTITRLGQGVDKTRALAPEAIERTASCLERYAGSIAAYGVDASALRVTGTSAMRDAAGADALRDRARAALGVEIEVIAGSEEARLAFVGALSGLVRADVGERAMVMDVGGGSTELVVGESATHRIAAGRSFDVGSVRMTERHMNVAAHDPPSATEIAAVEADVRKTLAPWTERSDVLVGVAGTVTTIAAVHLGMREYDGARIHGTRLSRAEVEAVFTRLASMPLAARRQVAGLNPARADVIVAGTAVVRVAMDHVGATGLVVSDRGLRWALCEELAT